MTYQQQLRYCYKHKQTKCPKVLFLSNLANKKQHWQEEGNEVIVLADMNEDVLSADINKFCQATHLVEAITAVNHYYPHTNAVVKQLMEFSSHPHFWRRHKGAFWILGRQQLVTTEPCGLIYQPNISTCYTKQILSEWQDNI